MLSKKKNTEKILCTILFLFVPIFFITLYILMVKSYEDILMSTLAADEGVGYIINSVYHYIPRLGEFYQQIATRYMTNTVTFGPDLVFRLITALLAWLAIYTMTLLTLGRRVMMKYKDILIYFLFFALFMILPVSEMYTYRFSFVNNYATCIFVVTAFFCFYRFNIRIIKKVHYLAILVLGFLAAISTELIPVIFLFMYAVFLLIQIFVKKKSLKEVYQSQRLQLFGVVGIFLGLMFFYLGGRGLDLRTNGAYAAVYDYLAPKTILSNPLGFIYKYYVHVWYNIRYILWMFILDIVILFSSWVLVKKKMYEIKSFVYQIILSIYGTLYLLGASLISIHDELYMRFLSPMYVMFFIVLALYIIQMMNLASSKQITLFKISILGVVLACVMYVDMLYGYIKYRQQISSDIELITIIPKQAPVVGAVNINNVGDMKSTFIFRWKTKSPFNWGDDVKYTKFLVNK